MDFRLPRSSSETLPELTVSHLHSSPIHLHLLDSDRPMRFFTILLPLAGLLVTVLGQDTPTCDLGSGPAADGTCSVCPAGQYSDGTTPCTPCANNHFSDSPGSSFCRTCLTPAPHNSTACPCGAGNGPTDTPTQRTCNSCPANTISPNGICIPCPIGQYSSPGGSVCTITGCPVGYFRASGETACTPCPSGTTTNQGGSTSADQCLPIPCNPGQEYSTTSASCVDCQTGTFSNGTTPCASCPNGSAPTADASSCVCQGGFYSPSGSPDPTSGCTACATGTNSTAGATQCTAITCSSGQGLDSNGVCSSCPGGTYSDGTTACHTCPTGSQSSGGASSCICGAGYYSDSGYASGSTGCAPCPSAISPGTTSCPIVNPTCLSASQTVNGRTTCPPGTKSGDNTGYGPNCVPCSGGEFNSCWGSATCQSCPAGTYSREGYSKCNNCTAGYDSNIRASSCQACQPGKYNPTAGGVCQSCPSGYANNK